MSRKYSGKLVSIQPDNSFIPLTMTEDHKVAVLKSTKDWEWGNDNDLEWKEAGSLLKNDTIIDINRSVDVGYSRLVGDRNYKEVNDLTVYDFEVEEDHSFIAQGIVVHNCVGAGGGNCEVTLQFLEIIKLGQREGFTLPYWLYTYGKSRQRAGMRGRGEGSTGSGYAEAARLDGYIPSDMSVLPKYTNDDGLILTSNIEMQWSDGSSASDQYISEAKKHLVKSTAPCATADDVREAIRNGYPCTNACSGFVQRGTIKGSGSDQVVFGTIDSNGGHQTSFQGWFEHPQLGEIFLYQNNWPAQSYPKDPAGGPPCSIWIDQKTVNNICSEGEVYAFSNFDGFPAQNLDKALFRIMG